MSIISDNTSLDWRESAALSGASLSVSSLVRELKIPVLVAEMLARRGFEDVHEVREFLYPSREMLLGKIALPEIEIAADRLLEARNTKEKVVIWGDFDADGQTSTALLYDAFVELGINVDWYVPNRFGEGHGLNEEGLSGLAKEGASLIVTCDCGSVDVEQVAFGKSIGLEFIITDHHILSEVRPDALALVNPQCVDADHPSNVLCGVGVAYKLVCLMFEKEGRPEPEEYLDLVALGTIADVAALTGENRFLVIEGLDRMKSDPRPGIKALMMLAKVQNSPVPDTEGVGFFIAPRLNAVGRLAHAKLGVELLITKTQAEAEAMIGEFERYNQQRKSISADLEIEVEQSISMLGDFENVRSFVLCGENWHAGVTGIVAGRIAERYQRPTALVSIGEDNIGRASARSVEGVHLEKAIMANSDLLLGGGGHAAAAGFHLAIENIEAFTKGLEHQVKQQLDGRIPKPFILIEDWIEIGDINPQWLSNVFKLAPFGQANPSPVWGAKEVRLMNPIPFGKEKDHTRFQVVGQDGSSIEAIWWRTTVSEFPNYPLDVAFKVEPDLYRGGMTPKMVVRALRASGSKKEIPAEEFLPDFHDYRLSDKRDSILKELKARLGENLEIWNEGEVLVEHGRSRKELRGEKHLAIWSSPPNSDVARRVIREHRPPHIYVLTPGLNSKWDVKEALLLTRLFLAKVVTKEGELNIEGLAEKSGLTIDLVKSLLLDLRDSGQITWTEEKGRIFISKPEIKTSDAIQISDRSRYLISEVASYRRLFSKLNLNKLL